MAHIGRPEHPLPASNFETIVWLCIYGIIVLSGIFCIVKGVLGLLGS